MTENKNNDDDGFNNLFAFFFKGVIVWWLVGVLFGLGMTATIIYVAWHFLSKVW